MKALNLADQFNNTALNKTMLRIQNILKEFDGVASFHILRDLNHLVDALENKSCLLAQVTLCINGETSYFHPIP